MKCASEDWITNKVVREEPGISTRQLDVNFQCGTFAGVSPVMLYIGVKSYTMDVKLLKYNRFIFTRRIVRRSVASTVPTGKHQIPRLYRN